MSGFNLKNFLFYGSLSADRFHLIQPLIWKRNRRILQINSLLSVLMGCFFLIFALISRSGTWLPYLLLLSGSLLVYLICTFAGKKESELTGRLLCYGQMLLVFAYASILSTQVSNYAIPATSVVVFISLLPISIDDRLIRMFAVMVCESVIYLIISRMLKSPEAFTLDVMNVATFCVIGMVIYAVICNRNIREIEQGVRIERIQRSVISSIATVVEERDENTGEHIARTSSFVSSLTEKMKQSGRYPELTDDFYNNVVLAAPMHDIGKIRVPDAILNKPGRLTDEEYEIIKKHPVYGVSIIDRTLKDVEDEGYFAIARNIAGYHHERYDGKGYPEGLSADEIPLEARIMALADVYDALISERVYKKAYSKEKARAILVEGRGTQFDPHLTDLFLECVDHE
ncbi:MAG: HD domain-containing protein [Lachnospiraceae bacterium]|nr:HD domain-containing protein [Lachnospiraceae bacterium]